MTWPPRETTEFIDWLDREFGGVKRAFLVDERMMTDQEACEVWGKVLLFVWKNSVGFDYFKSRDHVEHWVRNLIGKAKRFLELQEYGRLSYSREFVSSELVELSGLSERADSIPDGMCFRDERLAEAWAALSPKRRLAVECVVVGGLRVGDAAECLGVGQSAVSLNVKGGLKELKQRYEGTYVSRADAIRAAVRRKKVSEREVCA